MDNKEKDKKKRGQSITFPNVFTVKELNDVYPDIIEITLRYKIMTAIDRGAILQIGSIGRPVGRPHVVYGKAPLSLSLIQDAKSRGVVIYEDVEKKLKLISSDTSDVAEVIFKQSEQKVEV